MGIPLAALGCIRTVETKMDGFNIVFFFSFHNDSEPCRLCLWWLSYANI